MSANHDEACERALNAARTAHHIAYAQARRRVLDHLPPGAPDLASLDDEQRQVVQRWQAAEAEYDRLRRCAYEQAEQAQAPARDRSGD